MNIRREQSVVFSGSLLFFLLTLTQNFSGPHDSIYYLNGITGPEFTGNQHHLLYHYSAYGWFRFWHMILPEVKTYYLLESFSALWGSGSLVVVYSLFRKRAGFSLPASVLGLLPVAFSYGFWFYSTNIEVYAPPLFFLLCGIYLMAAPDFSARTWAGLVAVNILAILFHQINILFIPVVLYKLWTLRKSKPWLHWLFGYAAAGLVFVLGTYFVVGWFVEGHTTVAGWFNWLRGYTVEGDYWQPLSIKTPAKVAIGYSHAVIGGHYVFQLEPVRSYITGSLNTHSLDDELYIARNIPVGLAYALTALSALLFAAIVYLLCRFLARFRTLAAEYPLLLPPVLITGAVYSLFFMNWMPEILEFWILQTVLLFVILILTLNSRKLTGKIRPALMSLFLGLSLFLINFGGTLYWMQKLENDLYYAKVQTIQQYAQPQDLILLQDPWITGGFLNYFTPNPVASAPGKDKDWSQPDSLVTETLRRKGRILILPEFGVTLQHPDTRFIDSLKQVYAPRIRTVRESAPRILLLE